MGLAYGARLGTGTVGLGYDLTTRAEHSNRTSRSRSGFFQPLGRCFAEPPAREAPTGDEELGHRYEDRRSYAITDACASVLTS